MTTPGSLTYARRWGLLRAVRRGIARRLHDWLGLRISGVFARPLCVVEMTRPPELAEYTHRVFEPADQEELLAYATDPRFDIDERFVRSAFGKGDVCRAFFRGDTMVASGWIAFSPTHAERGIFVAFPPKHAYQYKAYTLSEFRGLHLWRWFEPELHRYCLQRGCTSTIAFIAVDNDSSIRNSRAMGAQLIGYAGYLKLGRFFLPFHSPAVLRCGFRFFVPPEQPTGQADGAATGAPPIAGGSRRR